MALFPVESLGNLKFLSQIGLILFMFVIGMELDLKALKNKANEAVVISHASIVIPFALGIGLAYFVYNRFAPEGVKFLSFSLFMGIAMSITAFPVLARIVQERGIHKTKLGTIVITCAAADDINSLVFTCCRNCYRKSWIFCKLNIYNFFSRHLCFGHVIYCKTILKENW